MNGQTKRIQKVFTDNPSREVAATTLHEAGSGKPFGWCGSLSRRISDLRELGMNIVMRDEYAGRQRHTFYTYVP